MTLREARRRVGLTQTDMARLTGFSKETISLLERRRRVRVDTMACVAHVLNRTIQVIVDPDGGVSLSVLDDEEPETAHATAHDIATEPPKHP